MKPHRMTLATTLLAACLLAHPGTVQAQPEQDTLALVRDFHQQHTAAILRQFVELLAIPNVAGDPEHAPDLLRNAEYIRDQLARHGFAAELWTLPAASPVVYAELKVPGAQRTLGLYAHYDGQPVDADEWRQPPFEPTLYTAALEAGGVPRPLPADGEAVDPEARLYARSAGDDKAPIAALLATLDALQAHGLSPTSNLRIFFEGEEEMGSPHLGAYMAAHQEQLQVDAWLICDGPVHQSRRPQLVFGARGVIPFEITVYGASRYLHSGHYGNWAPNPALMLAQLLASMKDDDGHVLIAGFYDSVAPVGEVERAALDALPDYDAQLRQELGLATTEGAPASLPERLLLPSLNIRGLKSAEVGATARNVIPTQATASFDIRLVQGNDPTAMLDLVEAHLRRQGYYVVTAEPTPEERRQHAKIVRFTRGTGYRAARTAMDLPIMTEIAAATTRAAGEPPLLVPTLGGSLPLYLFQDLLGSPLVIVPMANHDNNQHAPNENLRLANLWYGVDLLASLLTME